MPVVPLHARPRYLFNESAASDAYSLRNGSYLMTISTCVHPNCTANGARNSSQPFDPRQTLPRNVDTKARQRISGADGNPIAVDSNLPLHFAQAQHDVMMILFICQNVVAGTERTPTNSSAIEFMNNRCGLFFSLG